MQDMTMLGLVILLLLLLLLSLVFESVASQLDDESKQQKVAITYLSNTESSGAVCLDGSPPAYHLYPGQASWLIDLEGGGWCSTRSSCADRAKTKLGSSAFMETTAGFNGLLSSDAQVNPDFWNWTRVFVRYCDGASFSADVEEPIKLSSEQVLYLRGKRILKAVIAELKTKGLSDANEVLLSGCSAGGLAAILHCNEFRSFFSEKIKVKCLGDGGFFLNVSDINGTYAMSHFYNDVVDLHSLENTLDASCIESNDATKCFFPQVMQAFVRTPLFILNTAYDVWQLDHVKYITRDQYISCTNFSSTLCPAIHILQDFRDSMLKDLSISNSTGMFINSCFSHCQTLWNDRWNQQKVNGQSVAQAVGDWYFERDSCSVHVDCAYPCNPTCVPITFY